MKENRYMQKEDVIGFMKGLKAPAIKARMESYQDGMKLRQHICGKMRSLGIKEYFTSTVYHGVEDIWLLFWRVDKYGHKSGRDNAYKDAEIYTNNAHGEGIKDV